ncbi:MAG: hypothetical protein HYZ00_00750, partial [Candidatus Hydrogenedentes bacterium]|nr:hypothetical protein [Candidatus Hydrogenedentota bacterium]
DGAPLAYGDFGSLIEIRFTNITAPFVLLFDVLEPILTGDPNSKYFTHADSIPVDTTYARFAPNLDSFFEPAFPRPMILSSVAPSDADPLTFDFGTDTDVATLGVANIGGSHVETGVGLGWTISENLGNGLVTPSDFTGFVTSTLTPDTFTLIVDRSLNPGEYSNSLEFTYDFGSIDIEVPAQPIFITYEVLPPNLGVSPLLLDFGATTTELPLTVSNTGQSTMEWSLNSDLFPLWLSSRRNFDFVGPEVDETFNVLVNRQDVPPGDYEFTIVVSSVTTGQSFDVLVRMTVL